MTRQRSAAFAIGRMPQRPPRLLTTRFSGSLQELAEAHFAPVNRRFWWTHQSQDPSGTAGDQGGGLDADDEEDPGKRQMRLEAVLLLANGPLSPRKLSQLALLADATEARTLVRQLNRTYDTCGRALRVEQIAGGYRLMTRAALAPWLARLGHLPAAVRLSTPMMETLAVVAYRQPVSRVNVEAVRGVACGELLRQLMERDLIRMVGRSEELGRPYLYGTTKRFLQLFGLPNTASLPPIEWQTLQEDPITEDSPSDDLPTSTKEPVVSTSVASVCTDADPQTVAVAGSLAPAPPCAADVEDPRAAIDDADDDDDDDWDDDDDDWDDDDDDDDWDDDEDDLDDDDDDLDDDDGGWEEVDDEDADADVDLDADDDDDADDDADDDWDDDDDDDDDWDEDDVDDVDEDDDEDW